MFKNGKKRLTLLLVSLSLILVAGVGVTLALIIDSSGPVDNVFTPSHVSCAVVEDQKTDDAPTGQVKVEEKTNVKIKNTGDTDAYIRVTVIVNWKTADGKLVWAQAPVLGTDYTIEWAFEDTPNPTAWEEGGDGYYYFKDSVDANGGLTDTLINEAKQLRTFTADDGNTYYISIEIVASAIQSSLATSAQGAWAAAVTTGSN